MKQIILIFMVLLTTSTHAATYNGKCIDGQYFSAVCTDHEHVKPYRCLVLFEDNRCKIVFANGGSVTVELTSSKIEDLHDIESMDWATYFFWHIDLDTNDDDGDK